MRHHAHLRLLAMVLLLATGVAQSGEDVCEGHGYNRGECEAIPCCDYGENKCWSNVGDDECGCDTEPDESCEMAQGHACEGETIVDVSGDEVDDCAAACKANARCNCISLHATGWGGSSDRCRLETGDGHTDRGNWGRGDFSAITMPEYDACQAGCGDDGGEDEAIAAVLSLLFCLCSAAGIGACVACWCCKNKEVSQPTQVTMAPSEVQQPAPYGQPQQQGMIQAQGGGFAQQPMQTMPQYANQQAPAYAQQPQGGAPMMTAQPVMATAIAMPVVGAAAGLPQATGMAMPVQPTYAPPGLKQGP